MVGENRTFGSLRWMAPIRRSGIMDAAFFNDISGFNELTESLANEGADGTEALTSVLNDYLGHLIDIISEHGGEVVKFAGDALVALWIAESEPLPVSVALAVQDELHEYDIPEGRRLSVRIGLGAGQVNVAYVGWVFGRWEMLVTGHPLVQMTMAQQAATPGQVVASNDAWGD